MENLQSNIPLIPIQKRNINKILIKICKVIEKIMHNNERGESTASYR